MAKNRSNPSGISCPSAKTQATGARRPAIAPRPRAPLRLRTSDWASDLPIVGKPPAPQPDAVFWPDEGKPGATLHPSEFWEVHGQFGPTPVVLCRIRRPTVEERCVRLLRRLGRPAGGG